MKRKTIFILLCAAMILTAAGLAPSLCQYKRASVSGRGYNHGVDAYAFATISETRRKSYVPLYCISDDGVLYVVKNPRQNKGERYTFRKEAYPLLPFTLTEENFDLLLPSDRYWCINGWTSENVRERVTSAWYFESNQTLYGTFDERGYVYYLLLMDNGVLLLGYGNGEVTDDGKHEHTLSTFDWLEDLGPWEDIQNGIHPT